MVPAASPVVTPAQPRTHTVFGVFEMFPEIPRHQKLPRGLESGNEEGARGRFLQSLTRGEWNGKKEQPERGRPRSGHVFGQGAWNHPFH